MYILRLCQPKAPANCHPAPSLWLLSSKSTDFKKYPGAISGYSTHLRTQANSSSPSRIPHVFHFLSLKVMCVCVHAVCMCVVYDVRLYACACIWHVLCVWCVYVYVWRFKRLYAGVCLPQSNQRTTSGVSPYFPPSTQSDTPARCLEPSVAFKFPRILTLDSLFPLPLLFLSIFNTPYDALLRGLHLLHL